jgi:DNA helicase-2/ATP-dependent DNA helicase PcrA
MPTREKDKTLFDEMYKSLNPAQKEAVDAIEGPVMVIAGPGTGKTQILTLRIANILRLTDTPADAILALTFTESGVNAMRRRLLDIIGSEAYRVRIYTFHSFCGDLIRLFPEEYPTIIGSELITDIDKLSILKDLILATELVRLKPFGDNFHFVNDIRSAISELKRENLNPDELSRRIGDQRRAFSQIDDLYYDSGPHKGKMRGKYVELEKDIEKNEDLAQLYEGYQRILREKRLYDYDDMIMETVAALERDEDFCRQVQEQYLYLLADEHQDANESQNRILELVSSFHADPNLFIVGDEKQAIFRFQGASLENFLYFKRKFPSARLISLEHNYRSTQAILDSAHSLIESGKAADPELRKKLQSLRGEGVPIEIRSFTTDPMERAFIARDAKAKIKQGILAEEIAVLYRTNRDAAPIAAAFEREGVSYVIESDQNVLSDLHIQKLLALLRAVDTFGDDATLAPLLYLDLFNIRPLEQYKLLGYAGKERKNLYDVIRNADALAAADIDEPKAFLELYRRLEAWCTLCRNGPLLDCLERVIEESGLLASVLDDEHAQDKLEKLNTFFADATSLVESHRDLSLREFLTYVALLEEHNLMVRKHAGGIRKGAVRLMTAHKAKGLEFDWVYIAGAREGHWGNRRSRNAFALTFARGEIDEQDDERRLFYVALTRARLGAAISYGREGATGREQAPSAFIREIDERFVRMIDTDEFESLISPEYFVTPRKEHPQPLHEKEYLRSLFLEQGLSVTALNNYLECPWKFFFNSLLRVPQAKNKHAQFGTAIHDAFWDYFHRLRHGEKLAKDALLAAFKRSLSRQLLTRHDHAEMLEKGELALSGYYDMYHTEWTSSVSPELSATVHIPVSISGVKSLKLRGKIDRVEYDDAHRATVTDYKTGTPKSRNALEGKTKNERGDYKRQLVFYRVLLDRYENGKYRMEKGIIDFVEPDSRGKYHREAFAITDTETTELISTIEKVAEAIYNLSFWNERCETRDCDWCALRDKMRDTTA